MFRFSVKNVFRKKSIAILSSAGIGFGLMLMFVLGAFNNGVKAQFAENFSKVLGIVKITEATKTGSESQLPHSVLDTLLQASFGTDIEEYNVEAELPALYTTPYVGKLKNANDLVKVFGVNQTIDQAWEGPSSKVESGTLFHAGKNQTIIDSRLPGVAQFPASIGQDFVLYLIPPNPTANVTYNLTITGIYTQEDLGAPSFVPRSYYFYVDIATAWNVLTTAGAPSGNYTAIYLRFPSVTSNQTDEYVKQIKALSDAGGFGDKFLDVVNLATFQESIQSAFSILDSFVTIISFITLLAGGMAIIVSQLTSVNERKKEFAILKSTGWKNRHIFQNILYESLTLGILGAFIGMGLGFILIGFLGSGGGFFGSSARAIVDVNLIVQVLGFALGVGIVGGLYPGIKAARVRPVKVLKGE